MNKIQVPVLLSFNNPEEVIGYITLDQDRLPPTPDFVFSLGYKVLEAEPCSDGTYVVTKYELDCVSVVVNGLYKKYLDSKYST